MELIDYMYIAYLIIIFCTVVFLDYIYIKKLKKENKKLSFKNVIIQVFVILVICTKYVFQEFYVQIFVYLPIAVLVIIMEMKIDKKIRKESMSKIDFQKEKDYYREILKEYTPAELSYIDDFKVNYLRELVSTILNLQLKNKIEIKNDNIIKMDNSIDLYNKTESYIMQNIKNGKVYMSFSEIEKIKEYAIEEAKIDGLIEPVPIEEQRSKENKFLKKNCFISVAIIFITIIYFKYGINYIPSFEFFAYIFPPLLIAWIWNYYIIYLFNHSNIYKRTELGEQINIRLEGLRNYIADYSLLNEKDKDDLILWREYLIYSVILGINDSDIIKQTMKVVEKKGPDDNGEN